MTPINSVDMARLRKLLDLLESHGVGEMNLYVTSDITDGGSYVHLEVTGRRVPSADVKAIFALPVERLLVG